MGNLIVELVDLRFESGHLFALLRVGACEQLMLLLPLSDLFSELLLMTLLTLSISPLRGAILFPPPLIPRQSIAALGKRQEDLTSILSGMELLTWATTLLVDDSRRSGEDLYERSDPDEDIASYELSSVA